VGAAQVGEIVLDYERSGQGPTLLAIVGVSGTALHLICEHALAPV